MLSDDAYRREIDALIEKLGAWAAANRDFAHIIEERNALYWRLAVAPHVPGACRFELILRSDRRFDVVIGAETYEDRPVERFDDFVSLPIAVSDGRIITRTWFSAATGARHTVETIVDLGTSAFTGVRPIEPTASRTTREACIAHDRHWLAYRR